METRRRSIVKALSWRFIATTITALVAWGVTGKPHVAITIGAFDTVLKLAAYYGHERAWMHTKFGLAIKPEYEI